jgi:predicted permease
MMVIGQSMIHISLKDMFGDIRLLLFSVVKQLFVPVIGVLLLGLIIKDDTLIKTCFVMLSVPIGSMCAMLPQQYGGNYRLASKGVALSTLLSVVTIPLVSLILF